MTTAHGRLPYTADEERRLNHLAIRNTHNATTADVRRAFRFGAILRGTAAAIQLQRDLCRPSTVKQYVLRFSRKRQRKKTKTKTKQNAEKTTDSHAIGVV